jgi:arginyl-tRNA synthetase
MNITEKITKLLIDSAKKLGVKISAEDIVVEIPNDLSNGNYSTNIAMRLASELGKNPFEIAEDIVKNIEEDIDIKEVIAAKPGFVNFHLSNRYFLAEMSKIVERGEEYFKLDKKKGKKIVVEYTDANPFKEFHIGHLYSNTVGESFARLQEALGADVERACYQGDIGLHVAKTLWGLEKKLVEDETSFEEVERLPLNRRVKYLGESYILGSEFYDDLKDISAIKEIDDINFYLFTVTINNSRKEEFPIYQEKKLLEKYTKGRQWCLDFFEEIYKKVGTKFDYYFFESEVGESGMNIVLKNIGKVFERDGKSVIYRGDEEKNLHTRVFINKYGVPTYEAKEIGLAIKKGELIDYDESLVITADEQSGYFRVVLDALSKIKPDLAEKTIHIAHGKVKLPGSQKMSSRKGGILGGDWLIEETQSRVKAIMESNNKLDEEALSEISEKIAIGAIKYAFLKVGIGKDIVFDFDKSITFDGDTGPYLMYVYSRCNSVVKEAGSLNLKNVCIDLCLDNPFTIDLVNRLSKYKESLLKSSINYSPSILCQYLFDLGQSFNSFYQNVRVLDAVEDERQILLIMVKATMNVMKDGLKNLGIEVVERM